MKKNVRMLSIIMMVVMLAGLITPATGDAATRVKTTDLRYSGAGRYDTAFAVANELYRLNGRFDNVVVACGTNFPDALSGGYLTKVKNAPLILVEKSQEDRAIIYINTYMKTGGTVYLLGGSAVVRNEFENLCKINGLKVKRLAGKTAVDTNLEILKECAKSSDTLLIATRKNFADSLSGSSVGLPLMLVDKALTANQKTWLSSIGIRKFCILGGTAAVSTSIANELKAYGTVERCAGDNRYGTSVEIAKKFFPKANTITLVTGKVFPDGLSGAPIAMHYNSPIVLVNEGETAKAHNYVVDKNIRRSVTVGGTFAVTDKTRDIVMEQYENIHTHTYGEPSWTWKSFTNVTATFKCKSGDDTQTLNATVTLKTTPATTTKEGKNEYTATVKFNGKTYTNIETETLSKLPVAHTHTYSSEWSYDSNNHWHDCTAGDGAVNSKATHNFGSWNTTKVATETAEGQRERKCSVCKYVQKETLPKIAHTHSYSTAWKSDSTSHWHECTANDGATSGKASHTYGSWVTTREATTKAAGEKARTCTVCGYRETQTIDKLPETHTHTYSTTWEKDANYHWHECTAKDGAFSGKAGHTFGSWVVTKEATPSANGSQERACTVCGYKEISSITYAHTHTYSTTWKYNDTQHWHECTSNDGAVSGKANHTYGSWVTTKAATETSEGKKERTCTACGYKMTETIPKTEHEHTFGDVYRRDASYHWKECTAGDGYVAYKQKHTWVPRYGDYYGVQKFADIPGGYKTTNKIYEKCFIYYENEVLGNKCSVCGYGEQ